MLNILMVETGRVSENSTVAHIRNSIEITRILDSEESISCELTDLSDDFSSVNQYNLIIFNYAGMGCDFSKIEPLIDAQIDCRIGWITNEFELFANDFVKKRMDFMITNFEPHGVKKAHKYKDYLMTNLNTLIFSGVNPYIDKKYDVCYYGTYRKYREVYFKKYFVDDFILSTTKKNFKKFMDLGLDCNITDKFHVKPREETLNLFKATLYLEDTKTHKCFNHMANRFYEALQCNTALFFDRSCINTISLDNYIIDEYFIVDSSEELISKVNSLDINKLIEHTHTNAVIAEADKKKTEIEIIKFIKALV